MKSKYRSRKVLFASFAPPERSPAQHYDEPVEDLHKGEEAKAEEEAEQATKPGDKVNLAYSLTPLICTLQMFEGCKYKY